MFHPPSHNAPTHDLRYTPITCSHQTQTPLHPAPFPPPLPCTRPNRLARTCSGNAYNWRNEDPVVYRYPKRWGILQAESTTG
ncbi:hypothetical protein HBI18_123310 [Parastagonospora nodorum]|nr:hypothetical protein HBH82_022130 [Parastagonospora nodorum]KAH4708302.1 hypothetical protein HBH67_066360 [Parastagonospora nodorum]KAH5725556.1 hypothetical protein HBI18_123310 [Parastagonospora nodorum]KAH5762172.1 hypothetical protein HBI17_053380 [Parastagonospora nodorum]